MITRNPSFAFLNDALLWYVLALAGLTGGAYATGCFAIYAQTTGGTANAVGVTLGVIAILLGGIALLVAMHCDIYPYRKYSEYVRDANSRLVAENAELQADNIELNDRIKLAYSQLDEALRQRDTAAVTSVKPM